MGDVSGKVVMITGGTRGLGHALAVEFAGAGARVSVCGRRASGSSDVAEALSASTKLFLVEQVDVTDEASVREWVARTTDVLGPADVLINNASILGGRAALANYSLASWREVMEVNLTGTFVTCSATLPVMIERGHGSIINLSSGAAIPPRREWGAYAVSKSAVDAFSANLAAEVKPYGIRVNLVDPGAMRTEMRASAYPSEDPATVKRPHAIFPLFQWLASGASTAVTGERFVAEAWLDSHHRRKPGDP